MIKNPSKLRKFEKALIRQEKPDLARNFRLLTSMYEEAISLGVWRREFSQQDIETDMKIAKAVNSV